jgi:hypothetical protein
LAFIWLSEGRFCICALFFEETGGAVQPLLKSFIKKTNSNRADYKELTEFKTKEQSILTLRRLKRQRKKQKR